MEIKINELEKRTWNWLKVNDTVIELSKKNIEKNNEKIFENFKINEKKFEGKKYGLSKEYLEYTKNNLSKYIEVKDEKEIRLIKDEVDQNDNIVIDIFLKKGEKKDINIFKTNVFNTSIRIFCDEDSTLNLVILEGVIENIKEETKKEKRKSEEKDDKILEAIYVEGKKNCNVKLVKIDLGRNDKYANYTADLKENFAKINLEQAYILEENKKLDMFFVQNIYGTRARGDINIFGTQKENSQKIFKGILDFKKGAIDSVGNELENEISLGENTISVALPILLASEENIQGNHASKSGKYDEDILYYMQSRGFSEKEAKLMIAKSYITPVVDKIEGQEDLKLSIKKEIEERLKK